MPINFQGFDVCIVIGSAVGMQEPTSVILSLVVRTISQESYKHRKTKLEFWLHSILYPIRTLHRTPAALAITLNCQDPSRRNFKSNLATNLHLLLEIKLRYNKCRRKKTVDYLHCHVPVDASS